MTAAWYNSKSIERRVKARVLILSIACKFPTVPLGMSE